MARATRSCRTRWASQLYLRAPGRKSLLLVEGATHGDAASVDAAAYQAAFERLMPLSPERAVAGLRRRAAPSRAG